MTFRLLPRDARFFELLTADGDNLAAATTALRELVVAYDELDARVAAIQRIEKEGLRP
jgi:predicted ATPase